MMDTRERAEIFRSIMHMGFSEAIRFDAAVYMAVAGAVPEEHVKTSDKFRIGQALISAFEDHGIVHRDKLEKYTDEFVIVFHSHLAETITQNKLVGSECGYPRHGSPANGEVLAHRLDPKNGTEYIEVTNFAVPGEINRLYKPQRSWGFLVTFRKPEVVA